MVVGRGKYRIINPTFTDAISCSYEAQDMATGAHVTVVEFFPSASCRRGPSGAVSVAEHANPRAIEKLAQQFLAESNRLSGVTDSFRENGTAYYVISRTTPIGSPADPRSTDLFPPLNGKPSLMGTQMIGAAPKRSHKWVIWAVIAAAAVTFAGGFAAYYFLLKDEVGNRPARTEQVPDYDDEYIDDEEEYTDENAEAEEVEAVPVVPVAPVAQTNSSNGHDWVDMGTSVKWATCNIGSSTPRGIGNYYAWGETSPKEEYSDETSVTYGRSMGSIAGNPTYDAARANWGGAWRLPTKSECQELIDNCTWQWYGSGYKVTAPNGNVLYLPAAGWHNIYTIQDVDEGGHYWCANPFDEEEAYSLWIASHNVWVETFSRDTGYTIRPVLP